MDDPLGGLGVLSLLEVLTLARAEVFAAELPSEWQNRLVRDVTDEQWSTVLWLLEGEREQQQHLVAFLDQYQAGLGQQVATSLVPYTTEVSKLPTDLQALILSRLT